MARSVDYGGSLSPKTARGLLVPPYAADVPEPVAKANRQAEKTVAAFERANETVKAARRATREARGKGVKAAREAEETGDAATRERDRCRVETDRALRDLHDVVAVHHREWLDRQHELVDDARDDVARLAGELRLAFDRLGEQAGIARGLMRFNPDSESPKERSLTARPVVGQAGFRPRPDGSVERFAKPVPPVPEALLDALVEVSGELVPEPGRTALEGPEPPTAEQEEFQARRRGMAQAARGGVFVPGGEF